jgi:hypothetical protein
MEPGPFSEMLCSLEYRTLDKVQNRSNPKCDIAPSEPFRGTQEPDTGLCSGFDHYIYHHEFFKGRLNSIFHLRLGLK